MEVGDAEKGELNLDARQLYRERLGVGGGRRTTQKKKRRTGMDSGERGNERIQRSDGMRSADVRSFPFSSAKRLISNNIRGLGEKR